MNKKFFTKKLVSCFLALLIIFTLGIFHEQPAYAATEHNPVVLVHGLGGASYNFYFIKRYLVSQGWSQDELFAVDLPDKVLGVGNNPINSRVLSNYIDKVLEKTGKSKVDIVAHSMGGANSLYYITKLGGNTKVDKLVTLGGANRLVTSVAPAGVNVTSIYSLNDLVVNNYMSNLEGAHNIQIYLVGHIGLLNNSKVKSLIVQALNN